MNLYYNGINLLEWNLYEQDINSIDVYWGTSTMRKNDLLLLYVGGQLSQYKKGICGIAKVKSFPRISENTGRLVVDAQLVKICELNKPYIEADKCKEFIKQFRSTHRINPIYYHIIFDLFSVKGIYLNQL